ncbi:MAG: hypothetical protein WD607_04870, partial [Candidatus Paceibacterota bacterium]
LLLVILVTIIVGIATVVAINTFGSAADSANLDAARQDLASIAASAQGYYMKPTMLGGGGNSYTGLTFRNITFAAETISGDGLSATNANGTYSIETAADDVLEVQVDPSNEANPTLEIASVADEPTNFTTTEVDEGATEPEE